MIRRFIAVAVAGSALWIPLACGGKPFSVAASGGDASSLGDGPALDGSTAADVVRDQAAADSVADTEGADVQEEALAHCGGDFQCVPAVPVGWSGPAAFYLGATAVPACPAPWIDSFDGMEGLQAAPASCDCACGAPEVTCGPASLSTSIVSKCSTACAVTTPVLGACFAAPAGCLSTLPGPTGTLQTLTVSVKSDDCAPQSTVAITPPTWKSYARACTAPPGSAQEDCAVGEVCVPTPSPPFQAAACVMQAGLKGCPGEGYSVPHLEFTGLIDTRSCDPCTCGAPGKPECLGTLYAYSATTNGTCGGMPDIYDPAACVPTNAQADLKVEALGSGGPCAASDGTPSGTAISTGTTTLCCTK